jgi:hypothetical protein
MYKEISTRNASKIMLNLLTKNNKFIIGGSADVAKSVMTNLDHSTSINKESFNGQIINYGIREFAMGSINNGIVLHGGVKAFGGSFLVFSDYMKPSIRMASLMHLNNIYLFSHDSIAVGEDGPTHQPIEQLAMLRSIPGVNVIRPCNECETKLAYKQAFSSNNPVGIILTRQNLITKHLVDEEHFNKGVNFKKRSGYNECPICGNLKYKTSKLCSNCRNIEKKEIINNKTLGYYTEGKQYLTTKCNDIRKAARKTLEESSVEKVCAYCHNNEYDQILEVHHIKGILEFDKTCTIGEINSIENLVWLCPNHHRMLELGLIKL